MKRKAQPIVDPIAKCLRCGVSIGKPRRSYNRTNRTRPWVRFCPECATLQRVQGQTIESRRISAAKMLAWKMALSPEERSRLSKRGADNTSPETLDRKRKLCSESAKRPKTPAKPKMSHTKQMTAAAQAKYRMKLEAKIAEGLSECPHCKCTMPVEYFRILHNGSAGARNWSACKACVSIRKFYGRYPFIMKRNDKLNIPVDFRGFRSSQQTQAIYERYWLPKLDTGQRIYEGPSLGWQTIKGASPAPDEGAQAGTGSKGKEGERQS